MDSSAHVRVEEFRQRLDQKRNLAFLVTVGVIALAGGLPVLGLDRVWAAPLGLNRLQIMAILLAAPCLLSAMLWRSYTKDKQVFYEYTETCSELERALSTNELEQVERSLATAQARTNYNPLVQAAFDLRQPALDDHLTQLTRDQLRRQLERAVRTAKGDCARHLDKVKRQIPLIKAQTSIETPLARLHQRRAEISQLWDATYERMSWWDKFKFGGSPDFGEMDKVIATLETMRYRLQVVHETDFKKLSDHFAALTRQAHQRIADAQLVAEQFISGYGQRQSDADGLLKRSLLLSGLSIPVSVWADLDQAGDVYEALRRANGNFVGLSDSEIWLQTLFMPAEQFAGLASLTKGAYLEDLVAQDTGGTLHAYFNTPDTDIVVDGVAYQIKATDSASYIHSVVDGVPVIATTEVALRTDAIDAGYTNAELNQAVDLALGGSVIDVGDTVTDAILSGLGGLGLLATAHGINHAAERIENGGDKVEALFEGLGVAIEGTARTIFNTAELGYKALTSRPSRFIGRIVVKGIQKIDNKISSL